MCCSAPGSGRVVTWRDSVGGGGEGGEVMGGWEPFDGGGVACGFGGRKGRENGRQVRARMEDMCIHIHVDTLSYVASGGIRWWLCGVGSTVWGLR